MFEGGGGTEEEVVDSKEGREVVCTCFIRGVRMVGEGSVLSWTAFHSCVEFSLDMDIMPFAVPFRMKSAYSNRHRQPSSAFHHGARAHLFHTINVRIVNIEKWPITQLQPPW